MASNTSPLSAEDLAQFESLSFGTRGGAREQMQNQQPRYDQPPPGSPPPIAKTAEEQQQQLQQSQQQQYQQQQYQQQQPFAQSQQAPPQGMRTASTFTTHGTSNPEAPSNPYNPFLSSMSAPAPAPGQAQMQMQGQQQQLDTGYGQSSGYSMPHQQDSTAANMPSTNPFANPQPTYAAPSTAPYNPPTTEPPAAFPMVEEHQASAAGAGAPRGGVQGGNSAAPAPVPRHEDKAWPTKDVIFRGMDRKIVMQDENGPCSLIAIANILLLRDDLELQPPDRPLVNYDYLSSLIAEYLLTRPGDASLEQALSLLPQTQYGLNLNPGFISNETFYSSSPSSEGGSTGRPGQLALFDLLGIKLYHGFLPDPSSEETHDMLISHGSYDSALDQVVRGDAIAEHFFREAMGESGVQAPLKVLRERGGAVLLESKGWGTALQRRDLSAALEVSVFLDNNASQLTYPGLFALSALPEGTLCALFRFNHLSVLYRPRASELPVPASEAEADAARGRAPPTLLTLLTDEAFLDEGLAVWESLADVDGSASGEIYDGRFRRRVIDQSARAGRSGGGEAGFGGEGNAGAGAGMEGGQSGNPGEDADYALALQLHVEENERIEAARERRASRNPGGSSHPYSSGNGSGNGRGTSGSGSGAGKRTSGLFGALGKKGKNKNASANANASSNGQGQGALPEEGGMGSAGGGYGANGYEEARRGAADDFGSASAPGGGAAPGGPPGYGIPSSGAGGGASSGGAGGSYGGGAGEGEYDGPAGAGTDGRQQKKKKDKDCVIM